MCTLTWTTAVQSCLCRQNLLKQGRHQPAWDLRYPQALRYHWSQWDLSTAHLSLGNLPLAKKTPGGINTMRNLSPADLLLYLRAAGTRWPFFLDYLADSTWWHEPCDCTLSPAQHSSQPAHCSHTAGIRQPRVADLSQTLKALHSWVLT